MRTWRRSAPSRPSAASSSRPAGRSSRGPRSWRPRPSRRPAAARAAVLAGRLRDGLDLAHGGRGEPDPRLEDGIAGLEPLRALAADGGPLHRLPVLTARGRERLADGLRAPDALDGGDEPGLHASGALRLVDGLGLGSGSGSGSGLGGGLGGSLALGGRRRLGGGRRRRGGRLRGRGLHGSRVALADLGEPRVERPAVPLGGGRPAALGPRRPRGPAVGGLRVGGGGRSGGTLGGGAAPSVAGAAGAAAGAGAPSGGGGGRSGGRFGGGRGAARRRALRRRAAASAAACFGGGRGSRRAASAAGASAAGRRCRRRGFGGGGALRPAQCWPASDRPVCLRRPAASRPAVRRRAPPPSRPALLRARRPADSSAVAGVGSAGVPSAALGGRRFGRRRGFRSGWLGRVRRRVGLPVSPPRAPRWRRPRRGGGRSVLSCSVVSSAIADLQPIEGSPAPRAEPRPPGDIKCSRRDGEEQRRHTPRAVPDRRELARLPRVLRAARVDRHLGRPPDQRDLRLRVDAREDPHRLRRGADRRGVGRRHVRPQGDLRRLQGAALLPPRPAQAAVAGAAPARRGVRLPQHLRRGLRGRRRDRLARQAGPGAPHPGDGRQRRPRRVPDGRRRRADHDHLQGHHGHEGLRPRGRDRALRHPARADPRLHRPQGRHLATTSPASPASATRPPPSSSSASATSRPCSPASTRSPAPSARRTSPTTPRTRASPSSSRRWSSTSRSTSTSRPRSPADPTAPTSARRSASGSCATRCAASRRRCTSSRRTRSRAPRRRTPRPSRSARAAPPTSTCSAATRSRSSPSPPRSPRAS